MNRPLLVALLLAAPLAQAQSPVVTFGGQVRHRSELDGRDFSDTSDPVLFHLLRTRLGATVRPAANVRAFVQVQDARLFGGEDPAQGRGTLDGSADGLDLHQAYLAVDSLFGSGAGLVLGRQELAYGNERLVGAVGWSNVGRSFDAAVVRYRAGRVAADVFGAQLVTPVGREAGQHLAGLYTTWTLAGGHALDAFALYDDDLRTLPAGPDAGERRLRRVTPGLRAFGAAGRLDYNVEAIGQFGQTAVADSAARQDIGAYLVSAGLGYTVVPVRALRVGATYTRLSGDDDPADGDAGTFNTLFATNHKFYGFMDYFPALLMPYGLQDMFISVGGALTPSVRLDLDAHYFETSALVPVLGGVVRPVGTELDLTAAYRHSAAFTVTGGASVFFPGAAVEAAVGEETTYWLYLMTAVTF